MKIPNYQNAVIEKSKIVDYLLNRDHQKGGNKANFLLKNGYTQANWQQLADDLKIYHLSKDYFRERDTIYGKRYEIKAEIIAPNGEKLLLISAWQIDIEKYYPRLITVFPD